ncbi:MAG: MBOAT family protein [Lachnospiraceae bacterium]|nr:MBOAT family protein [Lachnospiraceae bacterium]
MPKVTGKNVVMLIFSLIFYAWGGPKYLLVLLAMVLICWFFALRIEESDGGRRKALLAVTCILVLAILGFFKYSGFILENVRFFTGFPETIPEIVLPIGISFYTFQLLSYVIDVYRGDVAAQKKFWLLLLYASLFHQCIAGPIVRYRDVEKDITGRKVNADELSAGLRRFCVGLAKKAVLANTCASLADSLLPLDGSLAQISALAVFAGSACYMLEIYLDFSAYSDMAIGMGLMVGFHYNENFIYPYISTTITEFWRRWHISLSSFFRDYVYIPLGGNRCKVPRHIFNLFVVWFLTGLWHGASWNYILWGLYFFMFLVFEKYVLKVGKKKKAAAIKVGGDGTATVAGSMDRITAETESASVETESALAETESVSAETRGATRTVAPEHRGKVSIRGFLCRGVGHVYVIAVVFFGWILFRFTNLQDVWTVICGLFAGNGNAWTDGTTELLLKNNCFFLVFAVIATLPLGKKLREYFLGRASENPYLGAVVNVAEIVTPVILLVISLMALVGDSYNPFLYFQF